MTMPKDFYSSASLYMDKHYRYSDRSAACEAASSQPVLVYQHDDIENIYEYG